MKTNIQKLCLLLAVIVFSLSSCNKDENSPESPIEPTTPTTATVKYSIPDRHEIQKFADITVYYTKADGTEASELMTSSTWEKTITGASVPGTYKIRLKYTRNNNALDQDSYKVGTGTSIAYKTSAGKSSTLDTYSAIPYKKEQIEDLIVKTNARISSIDIQ